MFNITLEYDVKSQPRYGYGKPRHDLILGILERCRSEYARILEAILPYASVFRTFRLNADPDRPQEPYWNNGFLPGLDVAALYYFICESYPDRYVEVGSGNSTMVARRAIRDRRLHTRIVSIDPYPRASVDAICDTVIRQPLEDLRDFSIFEALRAGDILFLDSSHRVFMNSDVTVFFLDILPRLAQGVIVHIHDVFLPDDYPPQWAERYYSEQYLLACYLLADSRFDVLLPNHFVFHDASLRAGVMELWNRVGIEGIEPHGGSFWLRTR